MHTAPQIAEIHTEATTYGMAKLSIREHQFIKSVYEYSQRPGFNGLTEKQESWLASIARKLNTTKGKRQWEILDARNHSRFLRYRDSYSVACFGR